MTKVFRVVVVAELQDVRERMRLAQRMINMTDAQLAERIGLSPQAFCQMWRRRQIGELLLQEIESVLGVDRGYWTAPLDKPERASPRARLKALLGNMEGAGA